MNITIVKKSIEEKLQKLTQKEIDTFVKKVRAYAEKPSARRLNEIGASLKMISKLRVTLDCYLMLTVEKKTQKTALWEGGGGSSSGAGASGGW